MTLDKWIEALLAVFGCVGLAICCFRLGAWIVMWRFKP
jgi:hypothetical protein